MSNLDFSKEFPFLFRRKWDRKGLDLQISKIDADTLCSEYNSLKKVAPRRDPEKQVFFVGHSGIPSSSAGSNRREEHIAICLVNMHRKWALSDGGWFRFLDYQVPLKARRADQGIGKIDLIGLSDRGRIIIVELKVMGEAGGISDPPTTALMEGLRYASIVEANQIQFKTELEHKFGVRVSDEVPAVLVLGERAWWKSWLGIAATGNWGLPLEDLADAVGGRLDTSIAFGALDDAELVYGKDGQAPSLVHVPKLYQVSLRHSEVFGEALHAGHDRTQDYEAYMADLNLKWWSWANANCLDELDGVARKGRPPKYSEKFTGSNISLPSDEATAKHIVSMIPDNQRHRHFGSFRSSQALAQSIFGAISAYGRFDLLAQVRAECGRPAFFDKEANCTAKFEHEVSALGEPRPTSIDVLLQNGSRKIAVECKFTEDKFGECSRPNLRPGQPGYESQHCDGTYSRQNGRKARCALTEIGVQYWSHAPRLFDWQAEQDCAPCPLRTTYQIARNAMAAVLDGAGDFHPMSGHMLFVYDARNPSYDAGGKADRQHEEIAAACRYPSLIRRVSWQRVLRSLAETDDLGWLVDAVQDKHGLGVCWRTEGWP